MRESTFTMIITLLLVISIGGSFILVVTLFPWGLLYYTLGPPYLTFETFLSVAIFCLSIAVYLLWLRQSQQITLESQE